MDNLSDKSINAFKALQQIIPLLASRQFKWVITGGFACYVYGVEREITDIDIDIDTTKDDPKFVSLMNELEPFITQSLEHYIDQNYDNYNFEATLFDVIVDICPMAELKMFNKVSQSYELAYPTGYPDIEVVAFKGIDLPLLAKEWIIKDKEQLVWQRESDLNDIRGLKQLL